MAKKLCVEGQHCWLFVALSKEGSEALCGLGEKNVPGLISNVCHEQRKGE